MMYDGRTLLEAIERHECMALLRNTCVGRIAVVVEGEPLVLPVNFVVDDDTIVFRTAEGTKFDACVQNARVAFEVDQIDTRSHAGWSVLVRGRAQEITDPDELARARRLPLNPWARAPKPHFVRLQPDTVSGRRIPTP
jgi:nitroimidazol reductase NimA-like FMN-containing flavoprotein (pyridoxamine 5'-phosphate oxidase superfamily)